MKNKRQQTIAELIQKEHFETQEDLAAKLNQMGFDVTQATISRDIRQMNLKKASSGSGKAYYVMPVVEQNYSKTYVRVLKESVIKVDTAMNLLVIKTQPGMAMPVAAAIDSFGYSEVVGTIAGDDTIMVAIRTIKDALIVQKRIEQIIEE